MTSEKKQLLRNGMLCNPYHGQKQISDILIKGDTIVSVADAILPDPETEVYDARGCIVCPGLIDLHCHIYPYAVPYGIDHHLIGFRSGVTTFVDAGDTGVHNFMGFREHVVRRTEFNLFAFLHICCNGLVTVGVVPGIGELQDTRLINIPVSEWMMNENRDIIVGVKVRLDKWTTGSEWRYVLEKALELAELTQTPLMVHMSGGPPSVEALFPLLRKGDIVSHFLRGEPNAVLDSKGRVKPCFLEAADRGIIMDVAHGKGSFNFDVAEKFLAQGLMPDVISSDVHADCFDGPARDLITTMSKLYNLGMPLDKIIESTTVSPARSINKLDAVGVIEAGRKADITLLEIEEGEFLFSDRNSEREFSHNLKVVDTFLGGRKLGPPAVTKNKCNLVRILDTKKG